MKKIIFSLTSIVLIVTFISCSDTQTNHKGINEASFNPITNSNSNEPQFSSWEDIRDNKVYKTVIIDGKEWLTENFDYESENSKCYTDDCKSFGRCYPQIDWDDAVPDSEGWRLPNYSDLQSLVGINTGTWSNKVGKNDINQQYCCLWKLFSPYGLDENEKSRPEINSTGFSAKTNGHVYNESRNGEFKWNTYSSGLIIWTQAVIGKKLVIMKFEYDEYTHELKVVRFGNYLETITKNQNMYSIRMVRDL